MMNCNFMYVLSIDITSLNYNSKILKKIKIDVSYNILDFSKKFCASIFMLKKTFFISTEIFCALCERVHCQMEWKIVINLRK